MAWIEVHQSLPTHRKTLAVAAALDIAPIHVVGHLVAFWLWSLDNAPDGRMNDSARTIAFAAQWTGNASDLVDALVDAGFLERTEDGYAIHNWWQYAGRLIDRRERNTERMRAARARHVQTSCAARAGATVPNRTVPNRNQEIYLPESQGEIEGVQGETAAMQPPPEPEAPIVAQPEPMSSNGKAPKVNRYAQVIDAVRALDPEVVIAGDRARNAKAVKECDAAPEVIAEAYVALWTGDWNDDFLRRRGSLHAVIDNLGGYLAGKRAPPARASPNGKPPISDELRRILERNP